jgi:hypothetical protein
MRRAPATPAATTSTTNVASVAGGYMGQAATAAPEQEPLRSWAHSVLAMVQRLQPHES